MDFILRIYIDGRGFARCSMLLQNSGPVTLRQVRREHMLRGYKIRACSKVPFMNFRLATEDNSPGDIYIKMFVMRSALRIFL